MNKEERLANLGRRSLKGSEQSQAAVILEEEVVGDSF